MRKGEFDRLLFERPIQLSIWQTTVPEKKLQGVGSFSKKRVSPI